MEVDAERAWVGGVLAAVAALVAGSLAFPRAVYAEFVWHYFWGPVYADAFGASCAAWDGGARTLHYGADACASAAQPVAYPGYTLVSEVGYMVTLVVAIAGVVLLLRRLDVGEDRGLFYALFPFMFFGGVLRVAQDVMDAARAADAAVAIGYPWNTLIISPLIYFTVFVLTLGALVGAVWLARTDRVERYEYPLFGAGTVLLALTVVYLLWLSVTTDYVGFYPQITVLTLAIATVLAWGTWRLASRYVPDLNGGTGYAGLLIIWGHAVDGTANVVGLDWGAELGLPYGDLVPKHPVNRLVIDVTQAVLPQSVIAVVGDAWPFLVLKLAVAVGAVWLFDAEIYEESPRYTVLLLVAVLAVGLGPGTRDMVRATLGV
ncbi:MAG: DUF63 family protein [Halobacteriaceae archaeon]